MIDIGWNSENPDSMMLQQPTALTALQDTAPNFSQHYDKRQDNYLQIVGEGSWR